MQFHSPSFEQAPDMPLPLLLLGGGFAPGAGAGAGGGLTGAEEGPGMTCDTVAKLPGETAGGGDCACLSGVVAGCGSEGLGEG